MKQVKQKLLIAVGTLSVVIGFIGIFVPILPTTPFLLLSAFCYSRSSKNFYNWLIGNRFCGQYVRNYIQGKGVPLKQKLYTSILLWVTILYTVFFIIKLLWLKFLLIFIAVAVTVHLIMIKTYKHTK
ncbi:YbaN family protein [bacterium]|nr:YbaN family protein [bacterium]